MSYPSDITERRRRAALAAGVKIPPRPKPPKGRAPGEPVPKAERLRALVAAADWSAALKLAHELPKLGDDKVTIDRAYEAQQRPDFARQLGRDPAALLAAAIVVLQRRFGAP